MCALLQVRNSLDKVNEVWSTKRCVIYTPTVEAGVNFDREHFDIMFVLLSAHSTHPLGVMQMTCRVRKLRSLLLRHRGPAARHRHAARLAGADGALVHVAGRELPPS
jgi:hypothetical protein